MRHTPRKNGGPGFIRRFLRRALVFCPVPYHATVYDAGTEDENGLTFSQRQLGKGLGAFCFGAVTHVYRKVGRQSQKYRVKRDDWTISQILNEHLKLVSVAEASSDVVGGTDINEETDYDRFVTVDGEDTDDEGEEGQGREMEVKLQGSVMWLKWAM